jgi:RNA polymerase sigma factor (sigma-70 family)
VNNTQLATHNPQNIQNTGTILTTATKRRGRLKKGEVIAVSGYKTMTMAEAFKSVEGMKHKIASKYKVFCDGTVSYEDLISAANIGLAWAYRDWDSNTAKFTTFSYPRIERQIDLYLYEMLPKYKNNVDAKNWLRTKNNESFQSLIAAGITKDPEFNEDHELDGTKTFTKEHYNLYTQRVANKMYNNGTDLVITSSSGFQSDDNENFNIFDTVQTKDDDESLEDRFDFTKLNEQQTIVANLILEGYTVTEIAKRLEMPKSKLFKLVSAVSIED